MNEFMLQSSELEFSYTNVPILQKISVNVRRGALCGFLGPNGSGKTTFFKCCLNFLKPHAGNIFIDDHNSLELKPAQMARCVSYVPQDTAVSFAFSVLELVLMGRTPHMGGIFGVAKKDYDAAYEAIEAVGLKAFIHTPVTELSGGQRQLVFIARALAQKTPLMILDEPASALDFKNQILLWRLLTDIVKTGRTVIVCTHDPNHILWFCTDVVAFYDGKVEAQGIVDSTMKQNLLSRLYGDDCRIHTIGDDKVIYPKRYR